MRSATAESSGRSSSRTSAQRFNVMSDVPRISVVSKLADQCIERQNIRREPLPCQRPRRSGPFGEQDLLGPDSRIRVPAADALHQDRPDAHGKDERPYDCGRKNADYDLFAPRNRDIKDRFPGQGTLGRAISGSV